MFAKSDIAAERRYVNHNTNIHVVNDREWPIQMKCLLFDFNMQLFEHWTILHGAIIKVLLADHALFCQWMAVIMSYE